MAINAIPERVRAGIKLENFNNWPQEAVDIVAAVADDGGVMTTETVAATNDTRNDMTLLPAVPLANDAYYFAGAITFGVLRIDISTRATGNTLAWEYYNGAAWAALSGVTDGTSSFTIEGIHLVTFTIPTDWATTTVNALGPYYWIRVRCTVAGNQPLGARCWYAPNTSAALLPVDASFDIHPETARTPDETSRGVLARSQESYEGMYKAVGSISGPMYPNLFGAILKTIFGNGSTTSAAHDADADAASDTWEHTYVFNRYPQPFTLVVEDPLPTADQVRSYGCIPSSLTISINAAEGVVTYSLDFEGVNYSDNASQTITAKQAGEGNNEFTMPIRPFKGFRAKAEIGSLVEGTDFRLVSAEITIERELSLFSRFGSDQYPTSYSWRAPKITLSLVTEFLTYTAYKYALDFEDYFGAVILQLCSNNSTITQIEAETTPNKWNILLSGAALDTNRGVLYMHFPNVDFGEGPVRLDRAAAPLTVEWSCEVLPDSSNRLVLYWDDDAGPAAWAEGMQLVDGTAAYNPITATGGTPGWDLS